MSDISSRFLDLYKPGLQGYGRYTTQGQAVPGQKHNGKAETLRERPMVDLVTRHLKGEARLGFIPIHREGFCWFGAIDIDIYSGLDVKVLAAKVKKKNLPLIVSTSKSGGAHLTIFFREPVPASGARQLLAGYAADLGYATAEIFPKQDALMTDDDVGNWINLPYFGCVGYALDENGRALNVEEFIATGEAARFSPLSFEPSEGKASDVETAAQILAPFWTEQRHNLAFATAGTLFHYKVAGDFVHAVVERVMEIAGEDNPADRLRAVDEAAKAIEKDKRVYTRKHLTDRIGEKACTEFLKACGVDVGAKIEFLPVPTDWLDEAPPPLAFVVKDLLPTETVALNVAESGTGKTTLLLKAAFSVATGRALLGKEVRQGAVAYVALEDRAPTLRRRVHWQLLRLQEAMRREKASPEAISETVAELRANLFILPAAGRELHLLTMKDFAVAQTARVTRVIEALPRPIELLIFDPMARLHGLEENSNALGTALVNACEKIAGEAGCAVLLSHHVPKAAAASRQNDHYSARGASGFVDAARAVWRLMVANGEDTKSFANVDPEALARGDILRLAVVKANDFAKPADTWLRRQELDFELWTPEVGNKALAVEKLLGELYVWWLRRERRQFTAKEVGELRSQVFAADLGRDRVREVIAFGVDRGDLVPGTLIEGTRHKGLLFREGYEPDPM